MSPQSQFDKWRATSSNIAEHITFAQSDLSRDENAPVMGTLHEIFFGDTMYNPHQLHLVRAGRRLFMNYIRLGVVVRSVRSQLAQAIATDDTDTGADYWIELNTLVSEHRTESEAKQTEVLYDLLDLSERLEFEPAQSEQNL